MNNFLKKFVESYSEFLKADGLIFFLLLILNITPIVETFSVIGTDQFHGAFSDAVQTFYFGAVVILAFLWLIHWGLSKFPRAKFFLQILILVGFAISFVVDAFTILTFKQVLNMHFIEVVLATNFNEAKEFLQFYVLKAKILLALAAFSVIIAVAIKKLRGAFQNISVNNFRRLSYYTLIILMPAAISLAYGVAVSFLTLADKNTILGRNIKGTYSAMKIAGSEPEIFATMDAQDEKIISTGAEIPYVVFVLGESEMRQHMQLYGYKLETTPLAVERYKRGELFKFNDVIACANGTSAAMKLIFTFSEKENELEDWYKTPNIFDILKSAGYYTAWISNQSPVGWYGNLDKIYSERCHEKYFTEVAPNENKNVWTRDFDGVLLPALDDTLTRSQEKNFYVIHLYGSHEVYFERYPMEFEKFTAENEDKPTAEGKKLSAEYDNSILYTDFILDEIIKRFEDKNALIIYISDHGDEVYENGNNFAGHSPESNGALTMIEIPMLVWTSNKFRELYPEKISALKNSADNPYRTDLIIHTVLDLMNIQTENFNSAKSIVNEKFDTSFERIYNGKPYTKN